MFVVLWQFLLLPRPSLGFCLVVLGAIGLLERHEIQLSPENMFLVGIANPILREASANELSSGRDQTNLKSLLDHFFLLLVAL